MAHPEAVLRLVSLAYEAVSVRDGWKPFLRQLAVEAGADLAAFLTAPRESTSFVEAYSERNPEAVPGGVAAPWPSIATSTAIGERVDADEPAAKPTTSIVLASLCGGCSRRCTIGLARTGATPEFARDARYLVRALLPYLRHVVALRARMFSSACLREAAMAALNRLSCGVVLLDADGGVLLANDVATRMFECSKVVLVESGRLALADRRDDARLRALVREVRVQRTGASLATGRTSDGPGVVLQLYRFDAGPEPLGHGGEPELVALLVEPRRAPAIDERTLARVFNLTNTEARLAIQLAGGRSVSQIAREGSVTVPTVRTHLHHVFSKTGASRQADLVRLLLAGLGNMD